QLNNDGEIDTNKLDLFHSRFALMDRQVIEQRVLSKFGKQSNSQIRNGQILIATQVVEQSLDLDFDIMISDLAPIDLLIQRVGRQQRHCRTLAGDISTDKLEHREPPVFYILSPDPNQVEDKNWLVKLIPGTAYVYPNIGQLWLGIRKLEQQGGFSMPEDARALIEAVYGEQTDDIPAALEQASLEAEAEQKAQRNMGKFNLLRLSMGYSYKSAAHNGGWTEDVNLPTRLGDETSEIAL
ncbi:MAG: CRISPR-associated helicase/endonuclease Cas3, partial [Cellvibrionaceae bacterium]|nr:CRISPR-associated helicase/endonuclease Cas3 [Cellvibrionaceae bacterium]